MRRAPRILLVPTNGTGLGHVTRAAAIGRRLQEAGATAILCTLSPLIAPFRELGLLVEHIPSYRSTPLERWHWQRLLADQLRHLVAIHGVDVVVFDGVAPYRGVLAAMAAGDAPPYVWVRRGRWLDGARPGSTAGRAGHEPLGFTLVIEPGEPDHPVSSHSPQPRAGGHGGGVVGVDAVLLHDHRDLLDRAAAAERLGLDPRGRYGLVSLGTGTAGPLAAAGRAMAAAMVDRGLVPVVARSPLLVGHPTTDEVGEAEGWPPGTVARRHYPLAPCLRAFTVAVVAAGYNSVAEVLACRAPAVVVPNPATGLDDQRSRAAGVAGPGLAVAWDPAEDPSPARALGQALEGHAELRATMDRWVPPSGAAQAAAAILELAG